MTDQTNGDNDWSQLWLIGRVWFTDHGQWLIIANHWPQSFMTIILLTVSYQVVFTHITHSKWSLHTFLIESSLYTHPSLQMVFTHLTHSRRSLHTSLTTSSLYTHHSQQAVFTHIPHSNQSLHTSLTATSLYTHPSQQPVFTHIPGNNQSLNTSLATTSLYRRVTCSSASSFPLTERSEGGRRDRWIGASS